MRVIDMHNHMAAPEVVSFLEREGERYATRIVEREGKRFFVIQDSISVINTKSAEKRKRSKEHIKI